MTRDNRDAFNRHYDEDKGTNPEGRDRRKRIGGHMKRLILLLMLLSLLFLLTGCFVSPDPTLEPLEINPDPVPFGTVQPLPTSLSTETPTPEPTATPDNWQNSDQSTWEDWTKGVLLTATPRVAATAAPDASTWETSTTDYNAGYPVLRLGSEGTDVSDLQSRLTELRYYTGVIDGRYSAETQQAVTEFQQKNGLNADGIAGRQTQDLLYSSSALAKVISATQDTEGYLLLKQGNSGLEVRKLQARLAELGYYSGGTDGVYGQSTTDAVKAFQRANGLSADGQAGTQTQTKLYSATAAYASTPVTTADPTAMRSLSLGMTGNDVYALQERLIELRYLSGMADGVYGEETQSAVYAFQKNNNLTPDGTAGTNTLKRIFGSAKAATGTTPSPVPAGATVLHEGDTGEAVYNMQARLFELGYFSGRIDGRFGADTTEAVRAFQQANGLSVDGVPGRGTLAKLDSNSAVAKSSVSVPQVTEAPQVIESTAVAGTLRRGDRGENVRELQEALLRLGYLSTQPDGQFGSGTESAIKAFQRANGLTADGIAGRGTMSILLSSDAVAAGSGRTQATATPRPNTDIILQWQSEGSDVLQYQARLVELGYLTSKNVTGIFNQPTVDATKAFQTMNGLKVDGAAGPQSLKLIYSEDAINADGIRIGEVGQINVAPEQLLKAGMTGEQVQLLQSRLAALGYLSASFSSGTYDRLTQQAVERFQRENGIEADGQAGISTQSLLYSTQAKAAAAQIVTASNATREAAEQRINGSNQTSLGNGGFLASGGGALYYADAAMGGALVRTVNGSVQKLCDDCPRDLHCTNGRLYYIARDGGSDCIIRMNTDGSGREILLRSDVICQMLLHDGKIYYLGAAGEVRERTLSGEERMLRSGVTFLSLDAIDYQLLFVLDDSVIFYGIRDGREQTVFTGHAEQAICCASMVLVLSNGRILRISGNETAQIADAATLGIGVYKNTVIARSETGITVMDINGRNVRDLLPGMFESMAVAGNTLYAGGGSGFTAQAQLN